jgi:hypothetical protein
MKAPRPRETIRAAEYRQQIGGISAPHKSTGLMITIIPQTCNIQQSSFDPDRKPLRYCLL